MSIIAGHASPREILIATDTIAVNDFTGGSLGEISKGFAFPHIKTVIAVRGSGRWTSLLLLAMANQLVKGGSFDQIEPTLEELTVNSYEIAAEQAVESEHGGCQVLFAGWSDARKRTAGAFFTNTPLAAANAADAKGVIGYAPDFERIEMLDGYFHIPAPVPADWQRHVGNPKKASTFDTVVACAKAQRDMADRDIGPGLVGGRVVVVRLTQWSIEHKFPFTWPDADELGAEPNAAEEVAAT